MKNLLMLLALGGVFAAGTACFGLFFPKNDPPAEARSEECAGMSGEARADCERRHPR
jgi:hypothetical protein